MEMTKEQVTQIVKAHNKVAECHKQLAQAQQELFGCEHLFIDCKFKNTKIEFWEYICEKYAEENLLNCYGDIFYVEEHEDNWYVGRRVLWNLELSEERYEIIETLELDSDGDYDGFNYEIKVMGE